MPEIGKKYFAHIFQKEHIMNTATYDSLGYAESNFSSVEEYPEGLTDQDLIDEQEMLQEFANEARLEESEMTRFENEMQRRQNEIATVQSMLESDQEPSLRTKDRIQHALGDLAPKSNSDKL
jgi:hypothetical protein